MSRRFPRNSLKNTRINYFFSPLLLFHSLFIYYLFTEDPTAAAGSAGAAQRAEKDETPMEVDELISDPSFLQNVLENLPGVDPQSETIRSMVGSLNKDKDKAKGDKTKKEDGSS